MSDDCTRLSILGCRGCRDHALPHFCPGFLSSFDKLSFSNCQTKSTLCINKPVGNFDFKKALTFVVKKKNDFETLYIGTSKSVGKLTVPAGKCYVTVLKLLVCLLHPVLLSLLLLFQR